jgi:hypothetical protein
MWLWLKLLILINVGITDGCPGAQNRIRTGDLVLTKNVLCQLSYLGRPKHVKKQRERRGNDPQNRPSTRFCAICQISYAPTNTR